MFGIFKKVISFIMSVFMMIFNIPSGGDPIVTNNIEIISNNTDLNISGEYIFETYAEFALYITSINRSDEIKEYADSLGADFFNENNLAIVDVTLANSGESITVLSAEENGNRLDLKYTIQESSEIYLTVICYDSICVKTSKQISEINAVELL